MKKFIKQLLNLIWAKKNYKFFQDKYFSDIKLVKLQKLIDSLYFEKHIKPVELIIPLNKKILVIAPHPDDEILGCGGYIIKAKQKKCNIYLLSLTLGSKDESSIREQELLKVIKDLAIDEHKSLGLTQKNLKKELSNSNEFEQIISQFKPDIILIPFILDNHPDHIDSNFLITKLNKSFSCEVICYQVYSNILTNTFLDITDVAEKKYDIMNNYKTQINNFDFINWNRGLCSWNTRHATNKNQKLIESYFSVPSKEYIKICKNFFSSF